DVPHQADSATHGSWANFAAALGRRARPAWIITAAALAICATFIGALKLGGLGVVDSFTNKPDALTGQKIYDANFPQGAGTPALLTARADKTDEAINVVSNGPGVAT